MTGWNSKVVWPKDGYQGRRPRGFFGGLKDIVTGKGPDMFIQDGRTSNKPIRPDRWGNWDSYTYPEIQEIEDRQNNGLLTTTRGYKRYDPESRRYVRWEQNNDFSCLGIDGLGIDPVNGRGYPLFTAREMERIDRRIARGLPGIPQDRRKMGHDWDARGAKRFRSNHREFWQDAHRIRQNDMLGRLPAELHDPVRAGPTALEMWEEFEAPVLL